MKGVEPSTSAWQLVDALPACRACHGEPINAGLAAPHPGRGFHATTEVEPPLRGYTGNASASRSASRFCAEGDHSPYVSTVSTIDECPSCRRTQSIGAAFSSATRANEWR